MTQIRVNLSSRVNNSAIRKEKRNGRDVIVVPSAVAKFNSVLNGILYSEEELIASYQGLDKIPAPLGHPRIGNAYVSAREPEAINQFWSGGWNTNPRIEGDRIMSEVVIDVESAKRHPDGERMLTAINNGDPISTSTGLLLEKEEVENQDYQFIGRNFMWDHLAILLDEPPAIGVEDGIGLMVNGEQVEVINSRLDMLNDEIEYSLRNTFELIESSEREKRQESKWANVKSKLVDYMKSLVQLDDEKADGLSVNHDHEEDVMSEIKREEFDALVTKVDTLVSNAEKAPSVSEQITEALKPVVEQMQANAEADKAKAKAEHDKAVEAVVNAEIFPKEIAEKMELDALNASLEKFGKPGTAYGVNGSFVPNGGKFDADALAPEA